VLVVLRIVQASTAGEESPTVEQIRGEQGVPVTVATADVGALVVIREFNGIVSGAQEAVVRARTGDQVASVAVSPGDRVR
jgi:multidrug efflux pump subunit AcrA (membrane-fusion protein)